MITKKISICGAIAAGKASILISLSKLTNSTIDHDFNDPLNLSTLLIKNTNYLLSFYTASGALFYEKETIKQLLTVADIVVYVIAVDNNIWGPHKYTQMNSFTTHVETSKSLKKSWADIPWVFVLNKTDLGKDFPDFIPLPQELKDNSLHTVADRQIGIKALFEKVLETANLYDLRKFPKEDKQ